MNVRLDEIYGLGNYEWIRFDTNFCTLFFDTPECFKSFLSFLNPYDSTCCYWVSKAHI